MYKAAYLIAVVFLMVSLSGCASPDRDIEIKPAPIHEVNISFTKSLPPDVIVYIKGGLPDGCTTFHSLKTERSDHDVKITVTVQRPKDAICTEIYGFFEKHENLGSDFTRGETYTVVVNDKSTTFLMP
jgi:hypothetical protein